MCPSLTTQLEAKIAFYGVTPTKLPRPFPIGLYRKHCILPNDDSDDDKTVLLLRCEINIQNSVRIF